MSRDSIGSNKEEVNELEQEKKQHSETRKALDSLRLEYNGCKEELMILQEENERVKIKFKDLKEIVDLSKVSKDI